MAHLTKLNYNASKVVTPHHFVHTNNAPASIKLGNLLSDSFNLYGIHGVDATLLLRIPAIHYLYSGNIDELNASIKGIEKVDRFHGHSHEAQRAADMLRLPTAVTG